MAGSQIGYIKGKMGLRGKTKPGEMITRMNKMKMKEWEKSPMDKALDAKHGYKEGSKQDRKADKKALAMYNSGKSLSTINKII